MNFEVKDILIEKLASTYLGENKYISHKLEPEYINYKKEYFSNSKFINLSFSLLTDHNEILCPITLEKSKIKAELNFFGDYVQIFSKEKINSKDYQILNTTFEKLKKKYYVRNLNFKVATEQNLEELNEKKTYEKVISDIFIDLNKSYDEITKNFKSNLRNKLKKNYDDVEYKIMDHNNYKKNEIFKMMKMHEIVSGKKTRSLKTWKINEEMILNKKGVLIYVEYKKEIISYSFFYLNSITCSYFSSCTVREYFKIIKNISDKSIWCAIKYLEKKSKNLFLGSITKLPLLQDNTKLQRVEKFKSKFSKTDDLFLICKNLQII